MVAEYYVMEASGGKLGPFDVVNLVKKIRSGKINADTEIFTVGSQGTISAGDLPELKEFFETASEHASANHNTTDSYDGQRPISPGAALKEAWNFFGSNQMIAITTGAFLLIALLFVSAFYAVLPGFISAILGTTVCGLCYFLLLTFVLRTIRHQPTNTSFITDILNHHLKPMALSSAFAAGISFGLPAALGTTVHSVAFLFIILGFIPFAFFIFTPFVLLDDASISYKEALLTSKNWVKSQGMDTVGAIVGILFINVLGATLCFFPLFITLPLTSIALAEIYEQRVCKS